MIKETYNSGTNLMRVALLSVISLVIVSCGGAPTKPTETAPVVSRPAGFPSTVADAPSADSTSISAAPSAQVAKTRYENPASNLIKIGRYLDAALLLSELAASVPPPQKQVYQLQIASLLLQGNYLLQAEQILAEINVENLENSFHIRKTMLGAQLALAQQKPEQATELLNSIASTIKSSSPELQLEFYNKQIDASYSNRDFASSAMARQELNNLIQND